MGDIVTMDNKSPTETVVPSSMVREAVGGDSLGEMIIREVPVAEMPLMTESRGDLSGMRKPSRKELSSPSDMTLGRRPLPAALATKSKSLALLKYMLA